MIVSLCIKLLMCYVCGPLLVFCVDSLIVELRFLYEKQRDISGFVVFHYIICRDGNLHPTRGYSIQSAPLGTGFTRSIVLMGWGRVMF